jgi:hypothetical protein
MKVSGPRALLISLGVGFAIGLVSGSLFALIFDKVWLYGVGTMLFITGLIAFVMGMLGALEPREGWATGKGTKAQDRAGRHSLSARFTEEHPQVEDASPLSLAVWGALVGLPLIGLSMIAFALSG